MRLTRRRLQRLPLELPRLDGTTWPDRRVVGRTSFAARALYQIGIPGGVCAGVATTSPTCSWPRCCRCCRRMRLQKMSRTCVASSRPPRRSAPVSESSSNGPCSQVSSARTYTSLPRSGLLRTSFPAMPAHQQDVARFLLLCGYYLARTDPAQTRLLVEALEDGPGVEPDP